MWQNLAELSIIIEVGRIWQNLAEFSNLVEFSKLVEFGRNR